MIRSFLAIELPKPILGKIEQVQGDLKSTHADVKWVSPEKIHLTLKFFGSIEESRIDPIFKSIEEPVREAMPFSVRATGVGAFPSLKNPRVVWIGLDEGKERLVSFQEQLDDCLEKIGFEPEDRAFQPHLTLGRMKSSQGKEDLVRRMDKYREEEFGVLQVERVALFKSDLRPSGPIYTLLRVLRLGNQ